MYRGPYFVYREHIKYVFLYILSEVVSFGGTCITSLQVKEHAARYWFTALAMRVDRFSKCWSDAPKSAIYIKQESCAIAKMTARCALYK